jgi:Leucine-rich repeat (LRR) protein
VYLSGEGSEKQIETGPGTLADLSLLEGMDHLDTLWLLDQPLRSLDGIEKLQELTEVRICACKNLEDISALLQLENLGKLDLISSRQKAVGSIEKLKKLTDLYIVDYEMKDLGGLSDWDTAFAAEEKGVDLRLECPLVSDYSFLSKIPEFRRLQLRKADFAAWINEIGHAGIHQLGALDAFKTQEDFEAFVDILIREHPEVTRLELRYNEAITDLSSLLKLPNLTYVNVSSEMWNAISSLDEKDYKFELDVFD